MSNSEKHWELSFLAGYIVRLPSEDPDQDLTQRVSGSVIQINENIKFVFYDLFIKSEENCKSSVRFHATDQQHPVRTLIRDLALNADVEVISKASYQLALNLAEVTDNRSVAGLFVVLVGRTDNLSRVVMWKFPANESIQAVATETGMSLALIKDVFATSSAYFKAALFEGRASDDSFWEGGVEDRQSSGIREASKMWVDDFLQAHSAMRNIEATRMLSSAIKETVKNVSSVEDRETVIAIAKVVKGLADDGRRWTVRQIAEELFPEHLRGDFLKHTKQPESVWDLFFVPEKATLNKGLRNKVIEIDNEFFVTGPLDQFDKRVEVESSDGEQVTSVKIRGRITSETVK